MEMIPARSAATRISSNRRRHASPGDAGAALSARDCSADGWVVRGGFALLFARQLSSRTSANSVRCSSACVSDSAAQIDFPLLLTPTSSHCLPRFADSIRGMLKLILVLMLAGASLASTWFTLTCLSRFTHLPTTAGQYAAGSHWSQVGQIGGSEHNVMGSIGL